MRLGVRLGLVVVLLLVAAQVSWGWLRARPDWAKLFDDAEVIAGAHVVGTPVRVPHTTGTGASWEFRARLAVDRVLKGQCGATEIPVVLQYGLSPSEYLKDGRVVRDSWREQPGSLSIRDTGSSAVTLEPLLADARQPALWFLAHYPDHTGRSGRPTEDLSLSEPEQLQPLTLLPFVRAITKPEPFEQQLAFLHDPDPGVAAKCVQYFRARGDKRAFPAIAELLKSTDSNVRGLATEAAVTLGGKGTVPYLRPLLATEDSNTFWSASEALAKLHDTGSAPPLVDVLKTHPDPRWRAGAARALGKLGEAAAIPALIAALKDDGYRDALQREVWQYAQEALEGLTKCRLSPNGDRAARWWEVAQQLPPRAWEHFGVAEAIASLPLAGPDRQERVEDALLARCPETRDRMPRLLHFGTRDYNPPQAVQVWQTWLVGQHWNDYAALPSQVDRPLQLRAELTAPLGSGQPVRLRYTLTNASNGDVWVTKQYYELLAARFANGNGCYTSFGSHGRPGTRSPEDFLRIPKGEERAVLGRAVLSSDYELTANGPIHLLDVGLCFDRKGTACGLDPWVGEVWAQPLTLAPGP